MTPRSLQMLVDEWLRAAIVTTTRATTASTPR